MKVFRGWHARQQALDVLACGIVSANGQFRTVKLDFFGTETDTGIRRETHTDV